ncbi:glycerophosphodiester phosphodiesterase family protein [Terriglobus sp. ADX1]|uniref:glycerophosphodiester phosphodiesterase family protein n=1 Tax=Terriglobus sp. ADX1 TaxID=2794063 RepID=UPI002FE53A06
MKTKSTVIVFTAILCLASYRASAQDAVTGIQNENPSLVLMRRAWQSASSHGAKQRPVLSPDKDDVFAGAVPIDELHREGFLVLPGTTSDDKELRALIHAGADGIITDRPDVLQRIVSEELAVATDEVAKARLRRFDVQGHRGARGLRPENTLPAYEEALDLGITTIELDTGVTADKHSSIWHDQFLNPRSCRRADGRPYTKENPVYFADITMADLQNNFICDKTYFSPDQQNDHALSPVASAFAHASGIPDPYSPVSLSQLFKFVRFYEVYYRSGQGKSDPRAAARMESAARIRFNIETKLIPDYLPADTQHAHERVRTANHTFAPEVFVESLLKTIEENQMKTRCEIESFDFRTLQLIEARSPEMPTYYLTGNHKLFPGGTR